MSLKEATLAFTFDDFVLAPVHSEVMSRKDPSVAVDLPALKVNIPVISSPMNTITEYDMANTMLELCGSAVLHRYMPVNVQVEMAKALVDAWTVDGMGPSEELNGLFVAVGANGDVEDRVAKLMSVGIRNFCVDVANGHSAHCVDAVRKIKRMDSGLRIMAGNVCTYEGTYNLTEAGADLIRVGIGPGSVCTTRLVTGHGVPQLSAIEECKDIKMHKNVVIVADGGIRSSGDAVKALAIGADVVMLGGMLSGTSDTPGDTIPGPGDTLYKHYHGMASEEGRKSWFERSKTAFVPEGVATTVPYKGKTTTIIENFIGGIKVGMSYAGALDLAELRRNAKWIRVSPAGMIEGTPHGKR